MEASYIKDVFNCLTTLKYKYRVLGKYIKLLSTDAFTVKEIPAFKTFLLANPNLADGKIDEPIFKGGKQCVIYFDSVLIHCDDELKKTLFDNLIKAEKIFFPSGRPVIEKTEGATGGALAALETEEARRAIKSDPLLADVLQKVLDSGALPDGEQPIEELMSDPKLMGLATTITRSLASGKYSPKDLLKTVDTISTIVGDDVSPDMKEMLGFLKKTVTDINNGKPPNMRALQSIMGKVVPGMENFDPMSLVDGLK